MLDAGSKIWTILFLLSVIVGAIFLVWYIVKSLGTEYLEHRDEMKKDDE